MRRTYTTGNQHDRIHKMPSGMEQPGIVKENSNGIIRVEMASQSGCAGCHALCLIGYQSNAIVSTAGPDAPAAGERVMVRFNRSSGYTAILFLYLVPFLLMLFTLVVMLSLNYQERDAGIASLFVLLPYFLLLYAFRKMLAARCTITIDRI
jgi:sigma-E factor negative regulatory protein RseC